MSNAAFAALIPGPRTEPAEGEVADDHAAGADQEPRLLVHAASELSELRPGV